MWRNLLPPSQVTIENYEHMGRDCCHDRL